MIPDEGEFFPNIESTSSPPLIAKIESKVSLNYGHILVFDLHW